MKDCVPFNKSLVNMANIKKLMILVFLSAGSISYGLYPIMVSDNLYDSDEYLSVQIPFNFTNPVPDKIRVLSKVNLSFYVNQAVVFQYRYRLEVPQGGGEFMNASLLRWTGWINRDINEVLIPKLAKEGRYKMVIEYRTHNSNEIKKYEKRFEVYSITPVNLAATEQTKEVKTSENKEKEEKQAVSNDKINEILQVNYDSRKIEQDINRVDKTVEAEIPRSETRSDNTMTLQDIIVKQNGEEIKSKVLEITPYLIKYIDYGRSDNPAREISISEVYMIRYKDGSNEIFSRTASNETQPARITGQNISKPGPTNSTTTRAYSRTTSKLERKQTRKQGNYLSIAAGGGNSYGGLGLSLQYTTPGNIRFGIHGGAGYFPLGGYPTFLYAGGVKLYFWDYLYLDAQFGSFGTYQKIYWISAYETTSEGGILYGPGLLLGYDWFFGDHVGVNVAAGASYDIGEYLQDFEFALDFGIVFRF